MKVSDKSVCVIGLGYIGLPTATVLANHGYVVSGVDIDPLVVKTINEGLIHIVEPGLSEAVESAVGSRAEGTPQSSNLRNS